MSLNAIEAMILLLQNNPLLIPDDHEFITGKDFYISYNPKPSVSKDHSPETALRSRLDTDDGWYILKGDFREDYKKIEPFTFENCKAFYLSKKDTHDSEWSCA